MAQSKRMEIVHLAWLLALIPLLQVDAQDAFTTTIHNPISVSTTNPGNTTAPQLATVHIGFINIALANIGFCFLTCPFIFILVFIFNAFRTRKQMVQDLGSDVEGVTQVSAQVMKKYKHNSGRRGHRYKSYCVRYTFTGNHPERGPFRVAQTAYVTKDLYRLAKKGGILMANYRTDNPKKCALAGEVYNASQTPWAMIAVCVFICILLAVCSVLPLYWVGLSLQHNELLFAALALFLALVAAGSNVGICCGFFTLWGKCWKTGGEGAFIEYGANVGIQPTPAMHAPVHNNPVMVQVAPAPATMQVVVPPGCVPGQVIMVQAPNGTQQQVTIPQGVSPGQTLQVDIPAPAPVVSQQQQAAITIQKNFRGAMQRNNRVMPLPAAPSKFNVVVPAGCVPGQVIMVQAPNGTQQQVTIPQGVSPGQTLQVGV